MIRLLRLTAALAAAGLCWACASIERAASDVSDFASHKAEHVTYPSLLDIPAKPTPATDAAGHKATLQSLEADKAAAAHAIADTRDQAANMRKLPVPGQPEEPAAPAQGTTTP